jgi:hypothetical protein
MVGVAGAGAFYRQCVDGLDVWKGKTRVPVLGTLVGGISGTVGRRVPVIPYRAVDVMARQLRKLPCTIGAWLTLWTLLFAATALCACRASLRTSSV